MINGRKADGGDLAQPERPPLEACKRQVTLRLDPDVIAKFRDGGPGWQGRINKAVGL